MDKDQVIRGAAHYNRLQAEAWERRALAAEARADELQAVLDAARQDVRADSHRCPHCRRPIGGTVPGGMVPPPPGTSFFNACGDAPR